MPKYDLDKTWELCLAQRAWIRKQIEAGTELDVYELKDKWMEDNGFEDIVDNCFFCNYVENEEDCKRCPGRLIDPDFDCINKDYHYEFKPLAFYDKLLELDKLRTGK